MVKVLESSNSLVLNHLFARKIKVKVIDLIKIAPINKRKMRVLCACSLAISLMFIV